MSPFFLTPNGNLFVILPRAPADALGVGLPFPPGGRPLFWVYLVRPSELVGIFDSVERAEAYALKRPNMTYKGGDAID